MASGLMTMPSKNVKYLENKENSKITKNGQTQNDNNKYGQFSKVQILFCGLDPGNLRFEIVRANKQRICF